MPVVKRYKIRKATKDRRAYEITIPADWLEYHGLREGDELYVIVDLVLVISPDLEEAKKILEK